MTNAIDKVLHTSIITYIFVMISVIIAKPEFMYDSKNNKFKSFGTTENETIMALPIFGMTSCIIIYFLVVTYTFIMIKLK